MWHDNLLERLRLRFGESGNALDWFASYLSDRTQRVGVNGGLSGIFPLKQGVPQGSCLRPIFFTVCTSKLFVINGRHLPTQLYLAFSPNTPDDAEEEVRAIRDCIADLRNWMINDRFLLNYDKTEFLLLGTRQQLAKIDIRNIRVGSSEVNSQPVVKNLGAWLDSTLTMSTHISKFCSAAFYHLHNISRIRKFLSLEVIKTLLHAFVTLRVDYCNGLLYGIPASQLNKVQRVLNAAARIKTYLFKVVYG